LLYSARARSPLSYGIIQSKSLEGGLRMYKKVILLFCLWFFTPLVSPADGLPDIQAVCKVELKNGTTIEGVILVARGGFNRYYDTNGFYVLIGGKKEEVISFDTSFYAIQPSKGIVEHSPSHKSGWGPQLKRKTLLDSTQVYYLHDIASEYFRSINNPEVKVSADTSDSSILLEKKIVYHLAYELLDYLPIFPKVPPELYLSITKSIEPVHIPINEIERFELVLEPSQEWVEQIDSVTKEWIMEHPPKEEWEFAPLQWFHQIMKEKDKHQRFFKPWRF
jgi:hypothetical protein